MHYDVFNINMQCIYTCMCTLVLTVLNKLFLIMLCRLERILEFPSSFSNKRMRQKREYYNWRDRKGYPSSYSVHVLYM